MRTIKYIISVFIIAYASFFLQTQAQLTISEVYFAGTDERIELTNTSHSDFSGELIISGAKSTPIVIHNLILPVGRSLLFGDSMDMVLNHDIVGGSGLGMSIYDTRNLFINLLYSGSVIDHITATADELAQIKSHSASLQKIISGSLFITTGSQRFSGYNIATGYNANPGIIYTQMSSSSTGDTNTGSNTSGDNNTGDNSTGETITGSFNIICSGGQSKLKITEIFPGDLTHPAFIELQAMEDIDEDIVLSGTLLHTTIGEQIRLDKNTYTLISAGDSGWLSIIDKHINTSLELISGGGTLLLYGQDGQVLDSVSVVSGTGGFSYYANVYDTGLENSGICIRGFTTQNFFSPGFDEKFLYYMSSGIQYIETGSTETIVYVTSGCDSTEGNTTGDSTNGSGGENPSVDDITYGKFIEIISIDYDPPGSDTNNEKIVLKSHAPSIVNVDHLRLHSLSRASKNRIYGDIPAHGQKQFIGNYRFPNSANCVELLSGEIILDTYCYSPDETNTHTTTTSTNTDTPPNDDKQTGSDYQQTPRNLIIKNIVYDASGSDKNRETITIQSLASNTMQKKDLEQISLMIGTRKNKLFYPDLNTFEILEGGVQKTFTGNFRFPNSKPTCIALMQNGSILDRYCYDIADKKKNDAKNFLQSKNTLNLSGKIKIISLLPNPMGSDVGAETISLLYTPMSGEHLKLNIDSRFHLQINTKDKNITTTLYANKPKTIAGNFSFPNRSACVSIVYLTDVLDTFCYENPTEGKLFTKKNGILEELTTIDLTILQKTSLKRINEAGDDKICLLYNKQIIYCKKYTFSQKDPNELKLYKNYVNIINEYLSNNRPTLFYNSPLQYYRKLLKQDKLKIHDKQETVILYGKEFKTYDIKSQAEEIIFTTPTEILQRKIIKQIIPDKIREQYYFLLHQRALHL